MTVRLWLARHLPAVAFACIPVSASAITPVPTPPATILGQPSSLVQIRECGAAGYDPIAGNSPSYNVFAHVSFVNTSQTPISAVKFQFDLYDAFDEKLGTVYGITAGTFAPGVLIEPQRLGFPRPHSYVDSPPVWHFFIDSDNDAKASMGPYDIARSMCSVVMYRREDGSLWKAGAAP